MLKKLSIQPQLEMFKPDLSSFINPGRKLCKLHFPKRIGEEGMKAIFKRSIDQSGKENVRREVKEVRVDTTVQEKNITFPTDHKLIEKVIGHCRCSDAKER